MKGDEFATKRSLIIMCRRSHGSFYIEHALCLIIYAGILAFGLMAWYS